MAKARYAQRPYGRVLVAGRFSEATERPEIEHRSGAMICTLLRENPTRLMIGVSCLFLSTYSAICLLEKYVKGLQSHTIFSGNQFRNLRLKAFGRLAVDWHHTVQIFL